MGAMLDAGFYTIQEAASLIGATDERVRAWLKPTPKYDPAVVSARVANGKVRDISFLDLIELNFVDHFRKQGVSLQTLRRVSAEARKEFGEHPFARNNIRYRTDRHKIYADVAEETGDRRLLELTQRQFELNVIEDLLLSGIDFDPETQIAKLWRPRKEFKHIVVDPKINFGRPSLAGFGVGTEAIHRLWIGESGNARAVADWFEIPKHLVEEALRFETDLAN